MSVQPGHQGILSHLMELLLDFGAQFNVGSAITCRHSEVLPPLAVP